MTARSGTKIQLTGAVREPALLRHWRRREAEFLRAWRPYDAELGREEGLKGGTTCCVVQAGIVMMAERFAVRDAFPLDRGPTRLRNMLLLCRQILHPPGIVVFVYQSV